MLYLENVLETMRDETNVIVNLSSSTAYGASALAGFGSTISVL